MNTNKILIAGLVGAVVAFLLGWLVYGNLLSSFFEANSGSATGVMREPDEMSWLPLILGYIAGGMLFALIFGRWASISTFATGAKAGALIGVLIALTFGLIQLGTTHLTTTTAVVVDAVVSAILSAIVGGAVGWMLGRGATS